MRPPPYIVPGGYIGGPGGSIGREELKSSSRDPAVKAGSACGCHRIRFIFVDEPIVANVETLSARSRALRDPSLCDLPHKIETNEFGQLVMNPLKPQMQAIDRAHRIGQERKVLALKLITRETVEERILDLQERKKQLAEDVIASDGSMQKTLSVEDVEALFAA